MPLERMQKVAGLGLPDFARAIIAPRDELIPILIKPTVRKRQHMRFQSLKQLKILLLLLLYLQNKL